MESLSHLLKTGTNIKKTLCFGNSICSVVLFVSYRFAPSVQGTCYVTRIGHFIVSLNTAYLNLPLMQSLLAVVESPEKSRATAYSPLACPSSLKHSSVINTRIQNSTELVRDFLHFLVLMKRTVLKKKKPQTNNKTKPQTQQKTNQTKQNKNTHYIVPSQ